MSYPFIGYLLMILFLWVFLALLWQLFTQANQGVSKNSGVVKNSILEHHSDFPWGTILTFYQTVSSSLQSFYLYIRLKIHKNKLYFLLYLHLYRFFNIFHIIVLLQTNELYSFMSRTIASKIDSYYLWNFSFYTFLHVRRNVAD